jgi:hypothetical protein
MEAREITSASDLEPGLYGLLEPKRATHVITPNEIGFAFIPCSGATEERAAGSRRRLLRPVY